VAGFLPRQILEAVRWLTERAAADRAEFANLYPEIARAGGNSRALAFLDEVFMPADSVWRALGTIPASGLLLRPEFAAFDAALRFGVSEGPDEDPPGCRCGEVITGRCDPPDCALFAKACTPLDPVGPCMVSGEGACQAYFRYRRAARPR
jgi:hydrogenase expression/formation protein HypD